MPKHVVPVLKKSRPAGQEFDLPKKILAGEVDGV